MATQQTSRPSFRDDQRALTRTRMRAAAGALFHGFDAEMMEQIAQQGVSRSTHYLHCPNKGKMLAALYGGKLSHVFGELRGPVPSRKQIEDWIAGLAALLSRERVPAMLISNMGLSAQDSPSAIRALGSDLIEALAKRLPHFAKALQDSSRRSWAIARAQAAMRELGWACLRSDGDAEEALIARLFVAADIFERFVHAMAEEPQPRSARPRNGWERPIALQGCGDRRPRPR